MKVNKQLLDQKIEESGLKVNYIAKKLGVSRSGFDKKRSGELNFRVSEIFVLCALLRINEEEQNNIFCP